MKQASSRLLCYIPAVLMGWTGAAAAQRAEVWNDSRVLELIAQARAERHSVAIDAAFRSYVGQARGHVYFFIDRPDSDERTLLKADQVALEVFWRAPNQTGQRIVGRRDERLLPTNIRYHLDHLTVVQDDFGDFIRLGDGDEVEQVLHPLGPDAESVYDFLLADSLSIGYGEGVEQTRVYQVRVRPKEYGRPGAHRVGISRPGDVIDCAHELHVHTCVLCRSVPGLHSDLARQLAVGRQVLAPLSTGS